MNEDRIPKIEPQTKREMPLRKCETSMRTRGEEGCHTEGRTWEGTEDEQCGEY